MKLSSSDETERTRVEVNLNMDEEAAKLPLHQLQDDVPATKSFGHVVIVAVLSMVVNIASTMVAPAMGGVARDLEITNTTLATWPSVSICWAAPLSLGGGTIADVIPIEKRGAAAALSGLGPLLAPVLGPVIGGFVAEEKDWRWTFWVVAILVRRSSGYGDARFHARNTSQHPVGTEGRTLATHNREPSRPIETRSRPHKAADHCRRSHTPHKLLMFSPIVLVMSIYVALIFGILYLLFATFSMVFEGQYGFSTGISGLAYLGLGIGELAGLFTFGILSDQILKAKMAADNVQEPKPEYRLILMMWFPPVIGLGLFIYGWTAYYQVHWIVPILGTLIVGFGAFFVVMPSQLYLVDLFGSEAAASALGANILLRSMFGAFLPLAGSHMYSTLNYGWGNTLLGFLALAFAPVPILFYRYGEWLRSRTTLKL
ncbi:uncharacterized protein N7498_002810 [Penicillium cinerascens]|uniref:Major facilitator superfamily (MFS) profile domain-containing protein n=1 Tax=Penicillium cinerascens TaxID=70096 RepID=A0A9W9NAT2_9EURO|nr:uncharacterized protein N7498_002810 [Penicillium cinerascens]KAJ5216403.1 hypothetical protein N7498_002810 [Penicillium cinerascens]